MDRVGIQNIIKKQKQFFESGVTLDINYRLEALKTLKAVMLKHESDFYETLRADFNKPEFETFSYKRSFLDKANWMDVPLRYPPYKGKQWLIKSFIK